MHFPDQNMLKNKRIFVKFESESTFSSIKFAGACISLQEILNQLDRKHKFRQQDTITLLNKNLKPIE